MPLTTLFCLIGAASISAFPLFSGFVTKSLVLDASAENHYTIVWAMLVFASAGVLSHSGIKIPFFTFFAHDSGKRPAEAPAHMLWAMGITAFLCIFIGAFPEPLYALLPYEVEYHPYTTYHVVWQLQLLLFALLAFCFLFRYGYHPPEIRAVNLDADVIYRRFLPAVLTRVTNIVSSLNVFVTWFVRRKITGIIRALYHSHGPEGRMARVWPTGSMVLWIAVILGATMIVNFV